MKILITGSHFTPAQAVIEELKKDPDTQIVYVGRKTTREGDKTSSIESQVLPTLGVKYRTIIAGRLQRSLTIYTIPSLLKVPVGLLQSFLVILQEKPDVVVSFGGYVAVPLVISAWFLSIPIIIHEQTLVTGLANTISSWFASKVALSFPAELLKQHGQVFGSGKVVVTGNPIRPEVLQPKDFQSGEIKEFVKKAKTQKKPLVLITGGNQGAHSINKVVLESLDSLTKEAFIIHQTGDSKFQDFEKLAEKSQKGAHPDRYLVAKWIDGRDMGQLFKQVDLCVSRAGINTLLELAYFGLPTLVIPLPHLYKNEQTVNAHFFAKTGLAQILWQKDLTAQNLEKKLTEMLANLEQLKKQAKNSKQIVILDAAKRLSLEILKLAEHQSL